MEAEAETFHGTTLYHCSTLAFYVSSQSSTKRIRSWNPAGAEPGNHEGPGWTWGVFWYSSKIPFSSEIMVRIKQKRGTGVKTPPPRSFWCGNVMLHFILQGCEDAQDVIKRRSLDDFKYLMISSTHSAGFLVSTKDIQYTRKPAECVLETLRNVYLKPCWMCSWNPAECVLEISRLPRILYIFCRYEEACGMWFQVHIPQASSQKIDWMPCLLLGISFERALKLLAQAILGLFCPKKSPKIARKSPKIAS